MEARASKRARCVERVCECHVYMRSDCSVCYMLTRRREERRREETRRGGHRAQGHRMRGRRRGPEGRRRDEGRHKQKKNTHRQLFFHGGGVDVQRPAAMPDGVPTRTRGAQTRGSPKTGQRSGERRTATRSAHLDLPLAHLPLRRRHALHRDPHAPLLPARACAPLPPHPRSHP